ncbi:MAG: hypothetical protein IH628_04330 [Proteobacteria bacterium]|nr:hypothetical protein [Pseudomonadota bacterium]
MIDVGVGEKKIRFDRTPILILNQQMIAKLTNTRAGIDDDEPWGLREAQFNAGGVPSIFDRVPPR